MAILVRKRKLVLVRMRVWFSGLSVFGRNAVVAKCQNVGVSAGRMEPEVVQCLRKVVAWCERAGTAREMLANRL